MELKSIRLKAEQEIKNTDNLRALDEVKRNYLGKKGKIAQVFSSLKNLSGKERKKIGKKANLVKTELGRIIKKKREVLLLEAKLRKAKDKEEEIDITHPGKKIEIGHLHPLTTVQRKIEEIFQSMGFSVAIGPEIENEWYNFDALNIPPDHPARDMQDTLWLKQRKEKEANENLLMRTQTSAVQVRYMEKHNPPLRIIVPGRVFRNETTDASHEMQFYQCEGLMVDKNVSVANFKAIIEAFLGRFFSKSVKTRLRPSYFPFTEPSFELDINCQNCRGKGCNVCKNTGWIEVIPGGMVHPNVFKAAGYNPKNWQGFAFGMGVDRLAMVKYKINDIRLFYSGDLRFLKQF